LSECKECTRELHFEFRGKGSVEEKTVTKLLNTLWRKALQGVHRAEERQEGMKHFFTRNTSNLSLAKYSVAEGVCEGGLILSLKDQEEPCLCAQSNRRKELKVEKLFEVSGSTKLRRDNVSSESRGYRLHSRSKG
jgi:hypothetical protein